MLNEMIAALAAARSVFVFDARPADLVYPDRTGDWDDPEPIQAQRETGTVTGDWDAFARLVQIECAERGVAAQLVACLRDDGRPHLVVEADGWIMDGGHEQPMRPDKLRYHWIAVGTPWRRC